MPRKVIDFSKTIIYKVVCNDIKIEDIYVGSTTDFTRRKCNHKNICINPQHASYNLKLYKIIRDNGGWINWEMIEIEKFPCNDSNEARARERYWYEFLNASLNTRKPIIYNVDEIRENKKEYYINNKEKLNEAHKIYNEINKEKLKAYQNKYRNQNESKIKEYQDKYRQHKKQDIATTELK
jgi:hypothetical protein